MEADNARLSRTYRGDPIDVKADILVFVSHNQCNRALLDDLADWPGKVIPVGDVRSRRQSGKAIWRRGVSEFS